jgi:CheY-like chemotaxis protein
VSLQHSPTRVLVVDDHPAALHALTEAAIVAGLTVVGQAKSGEEALRRFEELTPDMVLLDVQLPGLNGYEVADRIAAISPATTVCLVSARRGEPGRGVHHKGDITPALLRRISQR